MRKRITKYMMIMFFFFLFKSNCFGISNHFKFVIDTIGIPQYNVMGDEINEEIYQAYNVFSYSNPPEMYARTSSQRFKVVWDKGKWCENGGIYNGYGIRGEYNVLGVSYSGSLINNVFFPVDAVPETTPNNWNFLMVHDAYASWNDRSKYKYDEQLEYMKKTPLLFDRIDYQNNISDSYHLVEYGITSGSIGLDKVKLNAVSTWRTGGVVTVRRLNNKGQVRVATMSTKPMAASANVQSNLNCNDKYILQQGEPLEIPVVFGAKVTNLNDYAKIDHIKKIASTLWIDGEEVAKVEGSKTGDISKNISKALQKEKYEKPGTYNINIKVSSYLYTEFSVDGLMQDTVEKNITIQIDEKEIVPVEKIDVKVLEKEDSQYVVRDFIHNQYTLNESIGLIQNGKYLGMNIKFNKNYTNQDKIKAYINDKEYPLEKVKVGHGSIVYKIKLDHCENTLLGWNESRNQYGNYFNINFNEIGSRIKKPNCLKIVNWNNEKEYENKLYFDTIDDYKLNMNYILNEVSNKEALSKTTKLDDWLL
ncbi:MAG: hypothetical protein PHP54_00885 [Clostridia bacterium]|nr:hypothetical protein [Clostridia bacterium]